jgi:hypothetical protein
MDDEKIWLQPRKSCCKWKWKNGLMAWEEYADNGRILKKQCLCLKRIVEREKCWRRKKTVRAKSLRWEEDKF